MLASAAVLAVGLPVRTHAQPPPSPQPSSLTPAPQPTPLASPGPVGPNPTYAPSPGATLPGEIQGPTLAPSLPQPVNLSPNAVLLLIGHSASVDLLSPVSGIVTASGFDPAIARVVFDPIGRKVQAFGLHAGTTTATITDESNLSATLSITVQVSAGKAFEATSAVITGRPASGDFVADSAARAAERVSYPQPGASVKIDQGSIAGVRPLGVDDVETVAVPVTISGPGYYPYHSTVSVQLTNLAQPPAPPKYLLVSDYPETITENGTLFFADVNYGDPARLLYYHYAPKDAPLRRVLVKVQNNGVVDSTISLIAGLAGPSPDVLYIGHVATQRFLVREAAGEGEIFDVQPHSTINVVDQLLPANALVSGLMQFRVISGDGVRVAVLVQNATDPMTDPISDTLLQSSQQHARGIYQVPEFFYDEYYTVGADPTVLVVGQLPLPNLVQGQVLGGDYGVKQSADLTLLNPTNDAARVGVWFEPRGGRATGTFLLDGDVLQLHGVNPFAPVLLRSWIVPPHGYRDVGLVTMPEGGSSYPVNLLVSSQPPPGGGWGVTSALY